MLAVALGLSLGLTGHSQALDPLAPGLDPLERFTALIERVKEQQSQLLTMQADFVQYKESSLLLKPDERRGVLYYRAPDRVRWEYREPESIIVTITDEELVTWYVELGRADSLEVGSYSERIFEYLGASGSLQTLMKYFTVTAEFPESSSEPYALHLLPRYSRIKKKLSSMRMWIDGDTFLPQRLEYIESNGDRTEYRFSGIRINDPIPDHLFALDLPAEVEVKRKHLKGSG